MKGTTPTHRTQIPLRDDLRERLRDEAAREERSMAWLAERLIIEALDAREQRRKQPQDSIGAMLGLL